MDEFVHCMKFYGIFEYWYAFLVYFMGLEFGMLFDTLLKQVTECFLNRI